MKRRRQFKLLASVKTAAVFIRLTILTARNTADVFSFESLNYWKRFLSNYLSDSKVAVKNAEIFERWGFCRQDTPVDHDGWVEKTHRDESERLTSDSDVHGATRGSKAYVDIRVRSVHFSPSATTNMRDTVRRQNWHSKLPLIEVL